MNYLKDFSSQGQLMLQSKGIPVIPQNVNAHIHTPYSFSSFSGMEQAFEMALDENIKVLGINDFYVTDGYDEFAELAEKNHIFPMFNIEAIALSKELQSKGIRVNDPNNPGRTYMSGKGLNYPVTLAGECKEMLESVKAESQRQIDEMIEKLNQWLKELGIGITFTYDEIRSRFARQLVRERHIAQALRVAIFEQFDNDAERKEILRKIYSDVSTDVDIHNATALENELRNKLLKAGKKAFVREDEKAFLSIEEVKKIILNAGGIPCYPVLLDDVTGEVTEFEEDKEQLCKNLLDMEIHCIELIPTRNKLELLEPFVHYFNERGFVVLLGTEHNAPGLTPLTPTCRGGVPLTDFLKQVNYEGACIIAAHQYLSAQGNEGFVDETGKPQAYQRPYLSLLGNAIIKIWTEK